ncbi:MAG: hypothetical protein HY746_03795 [Elusimicrobia bacterium]|nr:hypothetical protein [Elusimicrobiota bacterium]
MSLNTFSAFLDFAIRLENSGLNFFSRSMEKLSGQEHDALCRFKDEAEKNIRLLNTVLKENVTEMVMEPCASIDEKSYLMETSNVEDWKFSIAIIEKQRDFLRDAAKSVNLKEVKRTFEKLADKKDRLILEYKQL